MARFFLILDGVRINSLEELVRQFNPHDILDRYRSGALVRWLAEQHLDELLAKVKSIGDNQSDDETIRLLGAAFGIEQKAKESLAELDEKLCGDLSDEEEEALFTRDQGETNVARLMKLAEDGNVDAQCQLGHLFASGIGVRQDHAKSFRWWLRAAESGDIISQYNVGVCYKKGDGTGQNNTKAFEWFLKAARQGDDDAQVEVGKAYCLGIGVEENDKNSIKWFRKAAEQGNAEGMYGAGLLLLGSDKPTAKTEAITMFRKAAEQDHAEALDKLGCCYRDGDGVKEDGETAVEWFRKAAELGSSSGQFNYALCLYIGRGIEEDEVEAAKWFSKAAANGSVKATSFLGQCYLFGHGVRANKKKAIELLRDAAERGDAQAQRRLGLCYINGNGVDESVSKAIEWWKKADAQGDSYASGFLGQLMLSGNGLEKDTEQGFKRILVAANETEDEDFQMLLGNCYEYGWGVAKDRDKAAKWYKLAADQGIEEAKKRWRICSGQAGLFETFLDEIS